MNRHDETVRKALLRRKELIGEKASELSDKELAEYLRMRICLNYLLIKDEDEIIKKAYKQIEEDIETDRKNRNKEDKLVDIIAGCVPSVMSILTGAMLGGIIGGMIVRLIF